MKKLGKLSINQSKLLENEELVNLRGGYGVYPDCGDGQLFGCWCTVGVGQWYGCYKDQDAADRAAARWCEQNQGSCIPQYY